MYQIHVNVCEAVKHLAGFLNAMEKSWKKLKTSNVFSSFVVCLNRIRSALVGVLLRDNSLFVGQLYEDRSLVLLNSELSRNKSLPEPIYFLNIIVKK